MQHYPSFIGFHGSPVPSAPVSGGTDVIHTIASFPLRGLLVLLVHLYWHGDRLGHAPAQDHADHAH
jgi:hypothetical protein